MRSAAEPTCTVVDCEEPGGPFALIVQTDPLLEAIVCREHSALASAGAKWFARWMIGGELAIYMDKSLPPRLHNAFEEDALSSDGACSRILVQLMDGDGKLVEVDFWAPSGWLMRRGNGNDIH